MSATLINPSDGWYGSHSAINALAWWYLNDSRRLALHSESKKPLFGGLRLKLWDDARGLGAGGEPTTLTVCESFKKGEEGLLIVREAVWHSRDDLAKLSELAKQSKKRVTYEPTISFRDAELEGERYHALLSEAASFSTPLVWPQDDWSICTDVGSRGFEYYGQNGPPEVIRLEWSFEWPAAWEPIIEWVGRLEEFLLDALSTTRHSA